MVPVESDASNVHESWFCVGVETGATGHGVGETAKFAISEASSVTVNCAVTVPAVTVIRPVREAVVFGATEYPMEQYLRAAVVTTAPLSKPPLREAPTSPVPRSLHDTALSNKSRNASL